ncbi:ATP-binding protein [Streptomyces sp. NPDC048639]|uniref:ATP-binding protein n=1 Tax=Streptomyces sp. NPDC048639 TaxID=3365581 RepID=UPI00371E511C
MNPNNPGPEGFDHEAERRDGERRGAPGDAPTVPQRQAFARTVALVAAEYLLTVNPVDGSEIEPCPPGSSTGLPPRRSAEGRAARSRAARPPASVGPAAPERRPVLERDEERERLVRLLSRGRSVRVTGPAGSGRTALLDAVAADCAALAPDGLVRLSGYRRTPTDLLYELYATVHDASAHRPGRAALLAAVQEIGAVVVLDDIEFGGGALDELLTATPECAFLIAATPDVAAPSPDSHLEEVFLGGLSRSACVDLLQRAVQRPLAEDERSWAGDLWFESEGLPLRFVQAGALLRQRDALRAEAAEAESRAAGGTENGGTGTGEPADAATGRPAAPATALPLPDETPALGIPIIDGTPPMGTPLAQDIASLALPSVGQAAAPAALLGSRLSEAARETMRFALALGGECPHQAHLPALAGDTHADAAVGELLGCGLLTIVGTHYRLAPGTAVQLDAAGYDEGAGARVLSAAQHYAWWAGHPSVTPERVAAEADSILAALSALVAQGEAGQPSAAVLLARTAAPAFAAAGAWGAWERALRHGQEAARVAGEVAEEAYFHHELGILALCTGNLDRARAELEAAIALRGALSDRRGAVAGRRALALVTDKTGGFVPGVGRTGVGEETADSRSDAGPSSPARTALFKPGSDETATVVTHQAAPAGGGAGSGHRSGLRRTVVGGTRRNVVAAGAGALLAAVLGTYVTIGMTAGDDGPADRVTSEQSANQDDGNNGLLPQDPSTSDGTSSPRKPSGSTSSGSPDEASPSGGGETSQEPSDSGKPSSSKPEETDDPPQTPKPPSSTTSRPTTRPPSSTRPPTPSQTPTSPTSPGSPSGSGSGSASQSAPGTPSDSGPASPTETGSTPTPTPTTSAPTTGTGTATP